MQITELNIYPVKSLRGVRLTAARPTPRGVAYDRHWMVVGAPFAERDWDEMVASEDGWRIGIRKPCRRCKVVTVDQESGATPVIKEPLKTLAEMATQPGMKGASCGQNAILLGGEGETVRVGDPVAVTPR